MTKPSFVYVTYIQTTPQKLWDALSDDEMTRLYWSNHRNVSDWQPGSKWEHQSYDDPSTVHVVGKVLESDPPRKLVVTWAAPEDAGNPEKTSRLTYEIEQAKGSVKLTVRHEELDEQMHQSISKGWPAVLSSLKTMLETGKPLAQTLHKCDG